MIFRVRTTIFFSCPTKAFTNILLMESPVGSPGSLHIGLELRFGSLNFQATGDGYLMRLVGETVNTPMPAPTPSAAARVPRRKRRSGKRGKQAKAD
jgi:hypothetical protein